MQLVFQQSKSYVFFAAVPSTEVVPQKGDSSVQSVNKVVDVLCTTVAYRPDSAKQLRSPTRSSTSLFSSPSGGASDSVIDRAQ